MLRQLYESCKLYDNILKGLPLQKSKAASYEQGKLLLSEAQYAFNNGKLNSCSEKISKAKSLVEVALKHDIQLLEEYFKEVPEWQNMVKNTISESRNNKNQAIVIDKFNRKCYLYQKGTLKNSFAVELGRKWLGTKKFQGDMATPEGYYKVTKKKSGRKTIFYKALLIDYPNTDDKNRFREAKKNGSIAQNAEIGGSIEIHGEGGKGLDWTDGCVALRNEDMDVLYANVVKGTRVTIVGSLTNFKETMKKVAGEREKE